MCACTTQTQRRKGRGVKSKTAYLDDGDDSDDIVKRNCCHECWLLLLKHCLEKPLALA